MTTAPRDLAEKARAVAERAGRLHILAATAAETVQAAETREALTRLDAGLALTGALAALAETRQRLQAASLAAYAAGITPQPALRRGRIVRRIERLLARLKWPGRAALIAASGLWPRQIGGLSAYARGASILPGELLFDDDWYRESNPDLAGLRVPALPHYLIRGAAEGRAPHPLFHPGFYSRTHAEALARSGLTPLQHYQLVGRADGATPHPAFDLGFYLAQGPSLEFGQDALWDYLYGGWRDGLAPHPLIDPAFIAQQAPRAAHQQSPLEYYLTQGWREGVRPHPLFDPAWYLDQNPDVAASGEEPLTHYLVHGARERRDPSPWFDSAWYAGQRGEALAPEADPLTDYLAGGAWIVAEPRPGFAGAAYLVDHPDLARTATTPLEHWARLSQAPAA